MRGNVRIAGSIGLGRREETRIQDIGLGRGSSLDHIRDRTGHTEQDQPLQIERSTEEAPGILQTPSRGTALSQGFEKLLDLAAQNLPFVLAVVAETLHPSLSLIWLDLLCEVKGIASKAMAHAMPGFPSTAKAHALCAARRAFMFSIPR
jgi:hypothetical protein